MPASQKIITKLRERRQIEAALRKMLSASSEPEVRRQAQEIAALGPQVIPTIVGNLDRADAQMLTAMGVVAALLDRDEVITALRRIILQPQHNDRSRMGAMTILERFLGQPLDDELLVSLRDPEGMAISSLEEMLDQADGNPSVLIDYVQGLDRQEPDIVLAVTGALRDMSGQRAVEPLRMMAQDVREEIAAEALQALGAIRLPESARALQTLIPIAAPGLRPRAERLLRKFHFVGVEVNPLPAPSPEWRVLVSAIDALGQQRVWFVQQNQGTIYARFLNVLLSDRAGAVEAVGHAQIPALMLPPRQRLGYVHDVPLPDGSGAMLLLEASFDLGRRLVVEALAHNRETQIPIAGTLRLLSPWLWGYSGAQSLPSRILPQYLAEEQSLAGQLLEHPAFATWTIRSEAILQTAEEALLHPGWDLDIWVARLASALFAEPVVVQLFHRRLVAISEWLLLAGANTEARLALAAAKAILEQDPADQPFVQALVRRDLELALHSVRQQSEPVLGTEHL
jgi:hypothetical protein